MLSVLFLLLSVSGESCKGVLDGALLALQQHDPGKASSILESAPSSCAELSSFSELQGIASDMSGKPLAAEQSLAKAVSLQPNEPRLLAELGTTYLKNNKPQNAVKVLTQAFTLDPGNIAITKYLISAYVDLNQWQDAADLFQRIGAGIKPGILSPPVMIFWFARSLVETNRISEIDSRLSPVQPGVTPSLLFSLAQLFAQHKMDSQVVRFLSKISAQDADDAVSFNLGLAYSHLKKFDEARSCYFQAIDKHPEHIEAYLHVGLDYASAGDSRRSIPWLARAHEFGPDRSDVTYGLVEQLLQLDYLKSAEEVLGSALKRNPTDPLLLVGEGDGKAAEHQTTAALEAYGKALAQNGDFVAALVGLARVNLSQGKIDEARRSLNRALSVDPDNPAAAGTLGLLEVRQGDWNNAVIHLRSSWEQDQANADIALELARAYSRIDRPLDALQVLVAVEPRMKNSAVFHLELLHLYVQLHKTDEAKKEQDAFHASQANAQGSLHFEQPQSYVF